MTREGNNMDPLCKEALDEIEDRWGDEEKLEASVIHDYAAKTKSSAIYRYMAKHDMWDDKRLAREHRIDFIRKTITIHTRDIIKGPVYVSLNIDRATGGGYRKVADVIDNHEYLAHAWEDCVTALEGVLRRYAFLGNSLTDITESVQSMRDAGPPRRPRGGRSKRRDERPEARA